ncbi:MAG: hypothetical protein ACFB00_01945 [Parvularculaceae bacterium]
MTLYGWRDPGSAFALALLGAAPFLAAAAFAPAPLAAAPAVDLIAPIADARAATRGAAGAAPREAAPFYMLLLSIADRFADAPGRIHLIAKALCALLGAAPLAYFCAARFPTIQGVVLTAAVAAYVVAPFAGPAEMALSLFLALAVALVCAPADPSRDRARFEGLIAGGLLIGLWTFNPAFALAGFIALSACPFLTGPTGLDRYAAAVVGAAAVAFVAEGVAPGLNAARAAVATGALAAGREAAAHDIGAWGVAGVAVSSLAVIGASAIFGGRAYGRGWLAGAGFLFLAVAAARLAGAETTPLFPLAAAMACLSVHSPFYDGVFRDHDRASIAVAASVAALTVFWTAAISVDAAGRLALQARLAKAQDASAATFALVRAPTRAPRLAERRIAGPDDAAALMEATLEARRLAADGFGVAILTGADTACVVAERRACKANGRAAADDAKVVFVPRADLDPRSAAVKDQSEALLYTRFKLAARTGFWEVWVRQGVALPAIFADASDA